MAETKHLVIANAYPDDSNIYSYGFLHRRVRKYLAAGLNIEIFRISSNEESLREYVFDGVTVKTGNRKAYADFVAASVHDTYLVHFPLDYILEPLREYQAGRPIIAWLHGYETESWHRRWFDALDTPNFVNRLKRLQNHSTDRKVPFLRNLYKAKDLDIRFVTVSNWFLEHSIEPDAGTKVDNISVIPNVIDDLIFPYVPKDPDLRHKILVIRPFTSHKYANDLVVKTILTLQKSTYFDSVEFSIYGDGPHFESTLAPLRALKNVKIVKSFLRQHEIASVHAAHGIFLSPTRWDSQGVSIGEAMSSGLVPVTTAISAIPEFIDDGLSGLMANPDDPEGLASCLGTLISSPETFTRMSKEAARRAQEMCGPKATTDREIQLIENPELGRNQAVGDVSWELAYKDLEEELFSVLAYFSDRLGSMPIANQH